MQKQSEKYLAGMEKLLTAQGTPNEPIDIVFVLGVPPREWTNERTKQRNIEQLATGRTRVVYYDKLLVDAEKSYRDYLEHRSTVDALGRIMQAIDDYAPAGA